MKHAGLFDDPPEPTMVVRRELRTLLEEEEVERTPNGIKSRFSRKESVTTFLSLPKG